MPRIWPPRPQIWPLGPQIWPLRPQIRPLRLQIRPDGDLGLGKAFTLLKAFNQLTKASHQHFQAGRTEVSLCATGLCPLWAAALLPLRQIHIHA